MPLVQSIEKLQFCPQVSPVISSLTPSPFFVTKECYGSACERSLGRLVPDWGTSLLNKFVTIETEWGLWGSPDRQLHPSVGYCHLAFVE